MKKILVCGAGGFIGSHLVKKLKKDGSYVVGIDIKHPEFEKTQADDFRLDDLRDFSVCKCLFAHHSYDEVYQLAADMGGAGYIFSGEHDADVMHNSAQINLNMADLCTKFKVGKMFYSSSACMYPAYNQEDANNPNCSEESAYPAAPDSEYGWEKLFSERLYLSFKRNYGLNIKIARFHNIYGPYGSWNNGKEKAPAAMCRKIAETTTNVIDVWGDGEQTRSFLYIDECLLGIEKLMQSDWEGPVNIGSNEMVSINQLVAYIANIANKNITINHISGPLGVRGRTSDNTLIQQKLNWKPNYSLKEGLTQTYSWIKEQVDQQMSL
jgi:nucleoside-diphosphate-sugar epimerase